MLHHPYTHLTLYTDNTVLLPQSWCADTISCRLNHTVQTVLKYLIIKPTRCTNFSNLFLEWNSTWFRQFLCPSSGLLHCTHSNGICHAGLLTAREQDQDIPSWSCSRAVSKPVWHIPLLCVQWRSPDDGQRNCLNHVEFHSNNKFEKLVHLVGFIIRNLTWWMVTWMSNLLKYIHHMEIPIIYPQNWNNSFFQVPPPRHSSNPLHLASTLFRPCTRFKTSLNQIVANRQQQSHMHSL
jgi:hypothetical protein